MPYPIIEPLAKDATVTPFKCYLTCYLWSSLECASRRAVETSFLLVVGVVAVLALSI
jgi:hypothetical protein